MRRLSYLAGIALAILLGTGPASAFEVNIDATALSSTEFLINGQTAVIDGTVVQTLDLPEGSYQFQPGAGLVGDFRFRVTPGGLIDFDAASDGFLSGRGTDTLVVQGYTIDVDATALSNDAFLLPNTFGLRTLPDSLDSSVVQTLTLVPVRGGYRIQVGAAQVGDFRWNVDLNGEIDFDPAFDGFLSGRGTDTLVVQGFAVNVDARSLTGTGFLLADTFGLNTVGDMLDSSIVQSFTLVPLRNGYRIQVGAANVGLFRWNIDNAGAVTYDFAFDAFLSGRETDTLNVDGLPIFIDATALGPGLVQVFNLFGLGGMSSTSVQALTLVPTPRYEFRFDHVLHVRFMVLPGGTIDYDPVLDICVSGRGTNHLIVWCDPGEPPTAEELIEDLQDLIDNLPAGAFRNGNGNLAGALVNKLNALLAQLGAALQETDPLIRDALLQDALDKVRNDILAKTDGCAAGGVPDANDWVTDCAVQADLVFEINRIIIAISSLI